MLLPVIFVMFSNCFHLLLFLSIFCLCLSYNCINTEYTAGKWVKNFTKWTKDFFCCGFQHNDYLNNTPICGSAKYDTSGGFMVGSNSVISQSGGNGCYCDREDRLSVSEREKYNWIPSRCSLVPWSSTSFCDLLENKKLLSFGDSTMQQTMSTLLSLVFNGQGGCSDNIISGGFGSGANWTTPLEFESLVDRFQPHYFVLTTGAHYHSVEELHLIWQRDLIPQLKRIMKLYPAMRIIWKTQNPGHVFCQKYSKPFLPCDDTVKRLGNLTSRQSSQNKMQQIGSIGADGQQQQPQQPGETATCMKDEHQISNLHTSDEEDRFRWRFHAKFDEINKQYAVLFNMSIIDMSPLYYRPDAHPAGKGDCLHYCLPGPLNLFAEIFHHMLATKEFWIPVSQDFMDFNPNYEPTILVTRGDDMPKKNYEKKLHPTYETCVRLKGSNQAPHIVVKFFDQYRTLSENLARNGVGEGLKFNLDTKFPPTHTKSVFGVSMSEEDLQQRCYMLNKWMGAVFSNYHAMPVEAQRVFSEFLSVHDGGVKDECSLEHHAFILECLVRRAKLAQAGELPSNPPPNPVIKQSSITAAGMSTSNAIKTTINSKDNNTSQQSMSAAAPAAPVSRQSSQQQGSVAAPPAAPVVRQFSNQQTPPVRQSSTDGGGRAMSTVSEMPQMLTSAELAEYSKETVVNLYLAVSVLRGELVSKGDTKLHSAYETIIRIIPFEELAIENKNDFDAEAYRVLHDIPSPVVSKAFDGYRQLKNTLEAIPGFAKPDAVFPKTYAKSSMGIKLSETELQHRVVILNRWMGALLRGYASYPLQAQEVINEFFGLNDANRNMAIGPMLLGTFQLSPTVKKDTSAPAPQPKSVIGSLFGSSGSSEPASSAATPSPPPAPVPIPKVSSPFSVEEDDRRSVISTAPIGANQLTELGREAVVNGFATVAVGRGDTVSKEDGGAKKHVGYETTIRIIPWNDLKKADKDEYDVQAYNRIASLPPIKVSYAFDRYRTLKTDLEAQHVFSREDGTPKKPMPNSVTIDAAFPRTHRRSSMGLGLTEAQQLERAVMLNYWVGKICQTYEDLPREAHVMAFRRNICVMFVVQGVLNEFLCVDMNQANHKKKPPPPPPPAIKAAATAGGKEKRGSIAGILGGGKGNNTNAAAGAGSGTAANGAGEANPGEPSTQTENVRTAACCVIM